MPAPSAKSLELLSTLEIEALTELVLTTFAERARATRSALWLRGRGGGLSLKGQRGYERDDLPSRIDPQDGPLAAQIQTRRPFLADAGDTAKLYVSFWSGSQALALLVLGDPEGRGFDDQDLAAAQEAAPAAAVALGNALRFTALERGGLRDRQSPTYNLSYFTDYAGKELYKAARYVRQFSVSILRFDNLEMLRDQLSPKVFADTLRALTGAVVKLARDSDVVARASENELYLLLPETDRFGMMMLERRIEEAVRAFDDSSDEHSGETRSPFVVALGSATFPRDGQDFDHLLDRCRTRLDEARLTLRRQLQLQGLDYWQSLATLLGPWPPRVEALLAERAGGPSSGLSSSYRGPLPEDHFARVQREIGKELSRDPTTRGLLYLGCGEVQPVLPLLETLPTEIAPRICLLVRREHGPIAHPAVTTLFLPGPMPLPPGALQLEFLLYLSEGSAYAYARRRPEPFAFHTSDRPLVDHLISRLQQAYDLQPY